MRDVELVAVPVVTARAHVEAARHAARVRAARGGVVTRVLILSVPIIEGHLTRQVAAPGGAGSPWFSSI